MSHSDYLVKKRTSDVIWDGIYAKMNDHISGGTSLFNMSSNFVFQSINVRSKEIHRDIKMATLLKWKKEG